MSNINLGDVKKSFGVIGLMFKSVAPKVPYFIPLPFSNKSIHTTGMYFSIHILFLDKDNKIVDIVKDVAPNKFIIPQNAGSVVGAIEFSSNCVWPWDIDLFNIGDEVFFEWAK